MTESPLRDDQTSPNPAVSEPVAQYISALAKAFISSGRGFGEFSDITKIEFCSAAARHIAARGGRVTTSRIALLTGLSRANVAQIRRLAKPSGGPNHHRPRHDRVIAGWKSDPQYLDASGKPSVLAKTGKESFASLCKKYSGDIPPRAILDELLSSKLVAVSRDKKITLLG